MSQYAKKIEPLLGTKWCLDCNLKLFLDCEMECFPSWKILITFQWKARSRDRGGQWSGTPWLLRACVAECSPEDLWSVYRKGATSSSSKMDDRCAPAPWVWNIIFFAGSQKRRSGMESSWEGSRLLFHFRTSESDWAQTQNICVHWTNARPNRRCAVSRAEARVCGIWEGLK